MFGMRTEESEKVFIENTDNKIKIFKNHSRVTNSESWVITTQIFSTNIPNSLAENYSAVFKINK